MESEAGGLLGDLWAVVGILFLPLSSYFTPPPGQTIVFWEVLHFFLSCFEKRIRKIEKNIAIFFIFSSPCKKRNSEKKKGKRKRCFLTLFVLLRNQEDEKQGAASLTEVAVSSNMTLFMLLPYNKNRWRKRFWFCLGTIPKHTPNIFLHLGFGVIGAVVIRGLCPTQKQYCVKKRLEDSTQISSTVLFGFLKMEVYIFEGRLMLFQIIDDQWKIAISIMERLFRWWLMMVGLH